MEMRQNVRRFFMYVVEWMAPECDPLFPASYNTSLHSSGEENRTSLFSEWEREVSIVTLETGTVLLSRSAGETNGIKPENRKQMQPHVRTGKRQY